MSQTGAELLFEVFSQRHERGSTIVTSNLPFEDWTSVFGAERLTGAGRISKRPETNCSIIRRPAKSTTADTHRQAGCKYENGPCRGHSHIRHVTIQWLVFTPTRRPGFDLTLTSRNSIIWNGGRTRTRTLDPLIKSQLLYQLSYAPIPAARSEADRVDTGRLARSVRSVKRRRAYLINQ